MVIKNDINIAISFNERYVPGALVALSGIAINANKETKLRFHLFTKDVKVESLSFMMDKLKELHHNSEIVHHICNDELLQGLPYWAGSQMAAVRCFYATLMPDVDWCLYLDCDILYLSKVEEHFSFSDDAVYACVVQEESKGTRDSECKWIKDNCGIEIDDSKYFNSGVVLFNFKKMREDNIPSKLRDFFNKFPSIPSPDQDALNAVFNNRVKMLPRKFNRLQIFLNDSKMKECPVVHYVSGNPWLRKKGVVANNRFLLWHAFADRYIFGKRGSSIRNLFTCKDILLKRVLYFVLALPVVGGGGCGYYAEIGINY